MFIPSGTVHEIKHAHLFAGLGGGARGFNRANPRVGTLLLAWSGQGFMLSSVPIWVQPVAVALSVKGTGHAG